MSRQLPLFPHEPQTPADISKQTPLGATLAWFAEHLRQQGKSEHTITAFLADMQLLGEHSGLETPLAAFSTSRLNAFLHWMEHKRGVPCSRKTYARRVTTLKVYFKWLHTLGAIGYDPAKSLLQRSGPAPLANVLTWAQVQAVIAAARQAKRGDHPDTRPEFLFRLLIETGIKKGETAKLTLADIDRANPNMPFISVKHGVQDNPYKERHIAISTDLLALCEAYIAQYQPQQTLFTCTTRNLEYILTDIGAAAGVPFKLSFESLRWTMAVLDWRAGYEAEFIREKLGLSKISWYETSHKIEQLVAQQLRDEGLL